ncbi:MAG: penicillin-insensitive murein endopeptidase [Myxococcales bacterium]|nr:penicillin-insensitive murein endopeptidase [Myxococcales bacterium]
MRLIPARIARRVIASLALVTVVGGCEAQAAEQRVGERTEATLLEHGEGEGEGENLVTAVRDEPDPGLTPAREREDVETVVADPRPGRRLDQQLGWRMPAHSPGELPQWIRHQTLPRETIDQLAIRYGVRADSLRAWNDMAADGEPAQRKPEPLRIYAQRFPPPRQQLNHAVREGESWGSIARIYGVDSSRLRVWNVSDTGRSLEVGETLAVWIDPVVYDSIVHDQPGSDRAALVRPGAHGVGTPQAGILVAGVQIPEGEGYELRYPNSAWGTTWAVRHTVAALDHFHASSSYPLPIRVGTMSRQRGGDIGGHNSHQTGRDLDIRLPLREDVPQALPPTLRRVDWLATWDLIEAFVHTGIVQVIFLDYGAQRRLYKAAKQAGASEEELDMLLQYPRGSAANLGLVRHAPGHEGHIHVRYPCGPAEPECADG